MTTSSGKLGVTEITNEDGINDFLGLNPPKFNLDPTKRVPTDNTNANKTETSDSGVEFKIDENELFTQDPGNNAERVEEIKEDTEDKKGAFDSLFKGDSKKEEEKAQVNTSVTSEDEETEIFSQLGAGLVKLGVLSTPDNDDKFTWTQDSFIERLEIAKTKGAEEMIVDFLDNVENGQELFQALFVDKVPIESFAALSKTLVDFSKIDISYAAGDNQEKNQVRVITEYLKALGQEESEIQSRIDWLKDTDKLDDYAGKYKVKLVEKSAEDRQHEQDKAKVLEGNKVREKYEFHSSMVKELRAAVTAKEIDGLPITDKEANELFLYATKPAYRVPATGQELSEFDKSFMELKKDPKKFIKLVKLVKNGLEIKDAVKVQSSKETNKIFNTLKRSAKLGSSPQDDPFLSILK